MRQPRSELGVVRVTLHARVREPEVEIVSFGLPLPPDRVADPQTIGARLANGAPLPVEVTVLERWQTGARTPRSVRLQLAIDFRGERSRAIDVVLDDPSPLRDTRSLPPARQVDADGPRVWAVLPATWMCHALLAGPQVPANHADRYRGYDDFVEREFDGSLRYIASTVVNEWLFDRTTCWYKMYVRTGELKFLEAAHRAAHFVLDHTAQSGPNAGAFTLKPDGDLKYVYPRAMHLHYLLTGDDRMRDAGVAMANLHLRTLDPIYDPTVYTPSGADTDPKHRRAFWSPRHQAYGLLGVLHGWELTGEAAYLDKVRACIDAYHAHQSHPPDGFPADGSWRQDWSQYDASEATYRAATSPWMTAILLDGLFHAWTVLRDARIPVMVTRWCDFMDRRGFVPDGSTPYYIVDCTAQPPSGQVGVDMDLHQMEMAYTFAMGLYFTSKPQDAARYRRRFDTAYQRALTQDMNKVGRSYNWAFQASSQLIYFMTHPGGGVE